MGKHVKFNPYEVLGLSKDCTEKDIQKAYKLQCLKWHPDKNLDNKEEAQRKFILAKEAFEFLYDKERKLEYDRGAEAARVRDEKQRERMEKADSTRRKLIEELNEREKRVERQQPDEPTPAQLAAKRKKEEKRVKADFEDLARRLFEEVEKEMRAKNERIQKTLAGERLNGGPKIVPKLRVRWQPKDGFDCSENDIRKKLEPLGVITEVSPIVATKKGLKMCIVEFSNVTATGENLALPNARSLFKLDWQVPPPSEEEKRKTPPTTSSNNAPSTGAPGGTIFLTFVFTFFDFHEMSYEDLLAGLDSDVFKAPEEKKLKV